MQREHTETLGERIRRLRKERGLSGSELCRRAGIARGSLGDVEDGRTAEPGATTFVKIALALEVSGRYLLYGTGNSELIEPDDAEAEAVKVFRRLSETNRAVWLELGSVVLKHQQPSAPE